MVRIIKKDGTIAVLDAKRILVTDGKIANAYAVEDIVKVEIESKEVAE